MEWLIVAGLLLLVIIATVSNFANKKTKERENSLLQGLSEFPEFNGKDQLFAEFFQTGLFINNERNALLWLVSRDNKPAGHRRISADEILSAEIRTDKGSLHKISRAAIGQPVVGQTQKTLFDEIKNISVAI